MKVGRSYVYQFSSSLVLRGSDSCSVGNFDRGDVGLPACGVPVHHMTHDLHRPKAPNRPEG